MYIFHASSTTATTTLHSRNRSGSIKVCFTHHVSTDKIYITCFFYDSIIIDVHKPVRVYDADMRMINNYVNCSQKFYLFYISSKKNDMLKLKIKLK